MLKELISRLKKKAKNDMGIKINVVAKIYDENNQLIRKQKGHNELTNGTVGASVYNARVMFLQRMTGDNDSGGIPYNDSVITQMELGTGSSPNDSGLQTPYSPDTTEVIDTYTWDYTTTPATSVNVKLSTSWDSSYPALSGINEAALQNFNNEALAIKTFSPALSKTTGGTITLEWTITLA